MNTIWGKSDSKITLARGVSWVGTPSHGGFAITVKAAQQYLTNSAIQRGERRGAYLFYEEDCLASIILFELPQALRLKSEHGVPTKEALIKSLSMWHADYLMEVGQTPDPEAYAIYQQNRLQDQLRRENSPDLIVSASGDWKAGVPKGTVEVTTADDSRWLIPAEDYDNRANLNLLSKYPRVKAAQ